MNAVQRYRERRILRLERRFGEYHGHVRFDADDEETNNGGGNSSGGHGNTRIPYGLCQREGIKIQPNWTPKDAWDALAGKGYSASDVYKELRETGKVPQGKPKEPEKPKLDKKQIDAALKFYSVKKREVNKLKREFKAADKELDEARIEKAVYEKRTDFYLKQIEGLEAKLDQTSDHAEKEKIQKELDENRTKFSKADNDRSDATERWGELTQKAEDMKRQIEDAEKSRKELGEQAFKAIESSPAYDGVMEYRALEEESRDINRQYENVSQTARLWNERLERFALDYEEAISKYGEKSDSAMFFKSRLEIYGKKAKEYEEKAARLRPSVEKYQNAMQKAKGDTSEKEWKKVYDTSIERDTVQEGTYDKLYEYGHKCQLNLKYVNPRKYAKIPTEEIIISKVGGGDETRGSCASLALAYLANKAGYDVLDFRGGKSTDIFARYCRWIAKDIGGRCESGTDDFAASKKVLDTVEDGKEYWFATGNHAAVVKRENGRLRYLELQTQSKNGWKELDEEVIRQRFKGKRRHKEWETTAVLIEADNLIGNPEVVSLLGYINTQGDKQKKGESGGAK